jgi:hypothetical protein
MGQGPFYRVARICRQPGHGGFACLDDGRGVESQGKLALVAAESLCLTARRTARGSVTAIARGFSSG